MVNIVRLRKKKVSYNRVNKNNLYGKISMLLMLRYRTYPPDSPLIQVKPFGLNFGIFLLQTYQSHAPQSNADQIEFYSLFISSNIEAVTHSNRFQFLCSEIIKSFNKNECQSFLSEYEYP